MLRKRVEKHLKKTDEADKKDEYTLHHLLLTAFNLLTERDFIDIIPLFLDVICFLKSQNSNSRVL